jgi:hypothetical protein
VSHPDLFNNIDCEQVLRALQRPRIRPEGLRDHLFGIRRLRIYREPRFDRGKHLACLLGSRMVGDNAFGDDEVLRAGALCKATLLRRIRTDAAA